MPELKVRPRKRFGQHFLEPAWVAKLVDALDVHPDDTFLEIGPGRGALTVSAGRRSSRNAAIASSRSVGSMMGIGPRA